MAILTPLPAEVEQIWHDYREAERVRVRAEMLADLDQFINRLLALPTELWHRWAAEFAEAVTEGGFDFPVRLPLFRRVLLPALADMITRQVPGSARWLSHFHMLLYHSDLSALPEHLRSPWGLLAEAIRVDPNDRLARERLVSQRADFLEYTLHELPAGVLYGHNGATESECDELLEGLEVFRSHVAALGAMEQYTPLIDDCEFHYTAYRDYLRKGRVAGSYAAYLAARESEGHE